MHSVKRLKSTGSDRPVAVFTASFFARWQKVARGVRRPFGQHAGVVLSGTDSMNPYESSRGSVTWPGGVPAGAGRNGIFGLAFLACSIDKMKQALAMVF